MGEVQDNQNILSDFFSLFLDGRVSIFSKLLLIGVPIVYGLSPIDFIPDVFLPLGIVDDGGIILSAMYIFIHNAQTQVENYNSLTDEEKAKRGEYNFTGGQGCISISIALLTLVGGFLLMAFVGILVSIFVIGMTLSSLFAPLGDFANFLNEPTTAQVVTPHSIVTSLQPMGDLVTVSMGVAQADIFISVDRGGMRRCNHSAYHVAQGTIEAGIDMTQIEEDSISYDEETQIYTLTLPYPSITSCNTSSPRQYEQSSGLGCTIDWQDLIHIAEYEATQIFIDNAKEGGILERAERETTLLMRSFVEAILQGKGEVRIVYADPNETELPASCQPQIPRGWVFNEELNAWVNTDS